MTVLTQNAPTWQALPNTTWTVGCWNSFLSRDQQPSSADSTSSRAQKKNKKKTPLFIYMEVSQLAPFAHHETLARAAGASRARWSWHQFPPLKLCKGPAVTQGRSILGWSAWVPREWTGDNFNWMNTIPSYSSISVEKLFLGDALQAPGTAERNTTQLDETGEWHIWHRMRSCSQG